jgi:hypothetical protein
MTAHRVSSSFIIEIGQRKKKRPADHAPAKRIIA